jgi:hypothetical protein
MQAACQIEKAPICSRFSWQGAQITQEVMKIQARGQKIGAHRKAGKITLGRYLMILAIRIQPPM